MHNAHAHACSALRGSGGGGVSWQQKLQLIDCSNLFQYKILLCTVLGIAKQSNHR